MTLADIFFFSLSIGVAGLIGYLIAERFCPGAYARWLVWAFAPVLGLGICSLIVFFFRRPMFTVEGTLLVVLLALRLYSRGVRVAGWSDVSSWRASIPVVILVAALGWAAGSSIGRVERNPHGDFDAWAIWNSHARYIASGSTSWKTDIRNTFHSDYPLLLAGATVHVWRYMGHDSPDAAGFLGIFFAFAGLAVLTASLVQLRSPTVALLMAFALIGTPRYLLLGSNQYADVPFSTYVLSTIALICLHEQNFSNAPGLMAMAGFTAGCAAWTKNEGMPFVVVTSAALLAPVLWKPRPALRRAAAFGAGLALPLAAIVVFKVTIAPPSDIFGYRHSAEVLAKIFNPDRYLIIIGHVLTTSWDFGGWVFNPFIPILVFVGIGVDRTVMKTFSWRAGVGILALLLASYCATFVITPMDLEWHIESSLDRLLMHLWPACLLLAGMTARDWASHPELATVKQFLEFRRRLEKSKN